MVKLTSCQALHCHMAHITVCSDNRGRFTTENRYDLHNGSWTADEDTEEGNMVFYFTEK